MASISTDKNGRRTIQFVGADGKRRTVRLGAVPMKLATAVKLKIEHLLAFTANGMSLDAEMIQWLGTISDELAERLAAVGLIPARKGRQLRDYLDSYIAGRSNDGATKGTTRITIQQVANDLVAVFGADADMRNIGPEDADGFKRWYQDRKLAQATIYRRLKMAKMLFGHAVKLKIIAENPFADIKAKNAVPAERQVYIPAEDIMKVIAIAKPFWRTLFALSRFGGLRTPSEALSLRWADVDLAAGRMVIHSPKTEHHEGGESRVCPVFAALRPHLEAARSDSEYVLDGPQADRCRKIASGPSGWQSCNLGTTAKKLIRRAGLTPWPKPFHNLRASCETDLSQHHPIHVVAAWIGNTPKIALGHYLQTLDSDFAKAIAGPNRAAESAARAMQNAVQSATDTNEPETTAVKNMPEIAGEMSESGPDGQLVSNRTCGQGGTRTHVVSPAILAFPVQRAAKGAAVPDRQKLTESDGGGHTDPRLASLVAAWPTLPDAVRAALCDLASNFSRRAA